MQLFNVSGSPLGGELQLINSPNLGGFRIGVQPNGDFVIAWSGGNDGNVNGIYGQRFNANGLLLGTEFQVNTYTTDYQEHPAISVGYDGSFMVTWDTRSNDIYAQRFSANGLFIGSEFRVNTYATSTQDHPVIGTLYNKDFVISWVSLSQDSSSYGIYARIFRPLSMANHNFTISQGQTITLTTNMLSVTSGTIPNNIIFNHIDIL